MDRHRRHLAVRCLRVQSEGVRIGQDKNREGRAVKVWDKREYKNLDDTVEIGTPQHQDRAAPAASVRARRCRVELDMPTPSARRRATRAISDIKMIPERATR